MDLATRNSPENKINYKIQKRNELAADLHKKKALILAISIVILATVGTQSLQAQVRPDDALFMLGTARFVLAGLIFFWCFSDIVISEPPQILYMSSDPFRLEGRRNTGCRVTAVLSRWPERL